MQGGWQCQRVVLVAYISTSSFLLTMFALILCGQGGCRHPCGVQVLEERAPLTQQEVKCWAAILFRPRTSAGCFAVYFCELRRIQRELAAFHEELNRRLEECTPSPAQSSSAAE